MNIKALLNIVLGLLLLNVAGYFAAQLTIYGVFLAVASIVMAVGVWQKTRWGYFSTAAWGFGCFWLARIEHEFIEIKSLAMVLSLAAVVLAIYLHEVYAKKTDAEVSDDNSTNNNDEHPL